MLATTPKVSYLDSIYVDRGFDGARERMPGFYAKGEKKKKGENGFLSTVDGARPCGQQPPVVSAGRMLHPGKSERDDDGKLPFLRIPIGFTGKGWGIGIDVAVFSSSRSAVVASLFVCFFSQAEYLLLLSSFRPREKLVRHSSSISGAEDNHIAHVRHTRGSSNFREFSK